MIKRLKSEEGAGLTEFAIMSVMLVPIMMVGVYASESMSAALKVREAEISSAWATTGYRLHNYNSAWHTDDRFNTVGNAVAFRTRQDLVDFDSAQNLANKGSHMVVTDAQLSRLDCGTLNRMAVTNPRYGNPYLSSGGWLSCKAHAALDANQVPTYSSVSEKKKFDDYGVLLAKLRNLNLQGMGPRGMVVLANDWALENAHAAGGPSHIGDGATPGNPQYWIPGKSVFTSSLEDAGSYPDDIVQRGMSHLLGGNDHGNTDGYKLGYHTQVDQQRSIPTPGPSVRAHLTPRWEDLDTRYYNRENDYLGSRNPYELGNK